MRKNLRISIAAILLSFTSYQIVQSNSNGSPGDYSGNTGQTCAITSCHIGNKINDGTGSVNVTVTDSTGKQITKYVPYKAYKVKVTVQKSGVSTWGYCSTIERNGTLAGVIADGNDPATQIFGGGTDQYATHTGTSKNTFTYTWQAPPKGNGTVTVFATGNAANGNGQSSGDHIYQTKLNLEEEGGVGIEELREIRDFKVWQNISKGISVNASVLSPDTYTISVYSLDGILISSEIIKRVQYNDNQPYILKTNSYLPGIYIVRVLSAQAVAARKIFIE